MRYRFTGLIVGLLASPAFAEDLRDLCPDRPGLGIPACVVDKGHLMTEVGIGDWSHDKQPDSITRSFNTGDIALRYGLTSTTEMRFEWLGYTHMHEKDRATGAVDKNAGSDDVRIGIKQSLLNPAGDKLSIALLPFATLPVGKSGIGAGTWGAGVVLPINYALSDAVTLELNSQIDAAPNESMHGRHLAYSGVVGLETKLTQKINATVEFEAIRDRDPEAHTTELRGAFSVAYQPGKNSQLDVQTYVGLNHNAPDVELLFGVSERF